ncbi:unnamed protein product, partial [Sphenostylis stenocarpa]
TRLIKRHNQKSTKSPSGSSPNQEAQSIREFKIPRGFPPKKKPKIKNPRQKPDG